MGLAASQAKLLFITQRQNDVSAKMQRISNDTMILARDDEEISAKYSKMLYATKMVLKGDDAFIYDNMMGASACENGNSNVITNASNRVVLNSAWRGDLSALKTDVGTGEEFVKAYPTAKEFQMALAPTTVNISLATKSQMIGFVNEYGSYPTEKSMTMKDLISKVPNNWGDYMNDACGARMAQTGYGNNFSNNVKDKSFAEIANGANGQDYVVILAQDGGKVSGVPTERAQDNFKNIGNQIARGLGWALGISDVDNSAYLVTMKEYINQLANSINFSDITKERDTNKAYQNGVDDARQRLVGNCTETYRKGNDNDVFTLNISEYVRKLAQKAMSIYSEGGINSPDTNVRSSSTTSKNLMNTQKTITVNEKGYSLPEYKKNLAARFPDADERGKVEQAISGIAPNVEVSDYYQNMYDNLKTNGWSFEDIDDLKAKLNDLASGYSISNSNSTNNSDAYVEVPDEETRKQASAWYETEMSKINRKEKKLQTELTKLQNEYTALTNDMNSVQSIIQGNIQRSFTFCQSG